MKTVYVHHPCDIIGGSLYNTKGTVVAVDSAKNEVTVRLDDFTHVLICADYIEQEPIPFEKPDLTPAEIAELTYWQFRGFNYLVRNEIGSLAVFVNHPKRDSENYPPGKRVGGYDQWVEGKFPLTHETHQRRQRLDMGEYDFVKWDDRPIPLCEILPKYSASRVSNKFKPELD